MNQASDGSNNSGNRSSKKNHRRRRHRHPPHSAGGKAPNDKRKRRPRRGGPRLSLEDQVYRKYENFLDQHLAARRKYYDLFNIADPRQKKKLENNFYKTLHDLRNFETSLKGEQQKVFLERYEKWGEFDFTYTENHNLNVEGEVEVKPEEVDDPHYLESQKQADYSSDSEETKGSFEDYLAYKGLEES